MKIPMPVAILAGGASKRMGRPKASLPFGSGTLLEHQIRRIAPLFDSVFIVAKEPPNAALGRARVLLDETPQSASIHGLARALAEAADRIFVVAVDLPILTLEVIRLIAQRSLELQASAVLPLADGRLQPLAAVWRRAVLPEVSGRIARGELDLHGLTGAVSHAIVTEEDWRAVDPSGRSFDNINTLEQYILLRERA